MKRQTLIRAQQRDEAVEVFNTLMSAATTPPGGRGTSSSSATEGLLKEADVLTALQQLGVPMRAEQLAVLAPTGGSGGGLSSDQFLALFERAAVAMETGSALVGMSQLWDAAKRDQGELVQKLILAGCNPCVTDGRGWTVLHHAARWGRSAILGELIRTIPVESIELDRGDASGWTPLMSAAVAGHTETVEMLLEAGASVDAVSVQGRSALHWAAGKGRIAVLEVLLAHGGGEMVQAADKGGWTPLHLALLHGQLEASQVLVQHGASLAQLDLCERDALSYCTGAATKEGDDELWAALVEQLQQTAKGGGPTPAEGATPVPGVAAAAAAAAPQREQEETSGGAEDGEAEADDAEADNADADDAEADDAEAGVEGGADATDAAAVEDDADDADDAEANTE